MEMKGISEATDASLLLAIHQCDGYLESLRAELLDVEIRAESLRGLIAWRTDQMDKFSAEVSRRTNGGKS